MSNVVDWPSHSVGDSGIFIQGNGDLITYECEASAYLRGDNIGGIQAVGLRSSDPVRWLKRIRLLSSSGNEEATITTENDNHGPVWVTVPVNMVNNQDVCQLEFVKAMTLYVPTGVYVIPYRITVNYPGPNPPFRMLFSWEKD